MRDTIVKSVTPLCLIRSGRGNLGTNLMLNQILYGPPGTGKTFAVVELALELLDPTFLEANHSDRAALKKRFDELSLSGDIRFITFHQSFSYEDFVEGLRADHDADGQIRYSVEDGIFKILCDSAAARITQQAPPPLDVEGRRVWKMSLGNTLSSDAYIYDECIQNNYILLGYGGDVNFAGCNSRDDVFKRSVAAGKSAEKDSYSITAVTSFLLKMKKGDLVVVSDGNTKFRAIGEITGDYRHLERDVEGDDKYGQCRDVKWLRVYSSSLPYEQLMQNQFSQMTLYELKSHSIDKAKLVSLLNAAGTTISNGQTSAGPYRIGEKFGTVGTGYEVVHASSDIVELIKPNKKRLPIGMSLIRELADCVRQGKLTLADIRKKEVFDRMPGSLLEPYLVNGYENILAVLVERYLNPKHQSLVEDAVARPKLLIIDEINRGNVAKIFGELITLIEPSKRKGAPEALEVILPYSKTRFSVPDSIHIVGTMNTADRSLTTVDIALRRRFHFKEMVPQPTLLSDIELQGVNIGQLLAMMNERIEVLLDRDHRLGHAYFFPLRDDKSIDLLASIFRQQIIPLLQEYFFDDWSRIQMVLNDHRKATPNRFLQQPSASLSSLFGDEASITDRSDRWVINEEAFGRIEAYLGIINHELSPTAVTVEREVTHEAYTIKQLTSGAIEVWKNGQKVEVAKTALLDLASKLGAAITYTSGSVANTRQLGKRVIEAVENLKA